MLIVRVPFCGHGYNMPNAGELIDPPEPVRSYLIEINVAEVYETKIVRVPEVKKVKKKQSASARQGRVSRKKTAKRSRKTATK